MRMKIIWLFAIVMLVDSILRVFRTSFNLGSIIMYLITIALWVYAIFHEKIDAFCAAGVGRILKIAFLCGCAVFIGLMILIHVLGTTDHPTYQEEAVIVLGAGLQGTHVSGILAHRLDAAIEYHAQNPDALIIVSGGQGPNEIIAESQAMKQYLMDHGIPEEIIREENKSTSTEENFLFSKDVLAENDITQDAAIVYVSNTFHCYRAGLCAAKTGYTNTNALASSIGFGTIMPSYIREVLAVMYYWVFLA